MMAPSHQRLLLIRPRLRLPRLPPILLLLRTQALKDGLMTMKDGKMMIVKGGAWVAMDAPVTCTNGRKVDVNGEVSKGDKKRKLEEGMMIDNDGQIKDKDGKLVDTSGWD